MSISILSKNLKTLIIGFLVLVASNIAISQTENDSITIVKQDICAHYFYQGQQLSFDSLYQMMKVNDEAFHQIKQAKGSLKFAKIFFLSGSFIIGYTIGYGFPNDNISGAGILGGILIGSIGIIGIVESNKYKRRAVKLYNSNLSAQIQKSNKIIFGFGQTSSGVGFSLIF